MIMEAPIEFGREATEKERKRLKKIKTMKTILKALLLLVIAGSIFLLRDDVGNIFAKSPDKGEAKAARQSSPDAGIVIVKKWDLPKALTEISGLSYLDGDRFACVQDETGTIYIYNIASSTIEKEIRFAGAGDYEGLALVGGTAWVVRSDGHLYEISNFETSPSVKEFDTHLTVEHNIEGLCYDAKNNRLLVAIKDAELHTADYKGIYAFDLASKTMAKEPVFRIDMNHELFRNTASKKKKGGAVMPSSIAIHPQTGQMYITDGRKSTLLVLNSDGTVRKFLQLNSSDFAQPEGITFKPSGELYISNEGPKQPANILNVAIAD
jgi:uncharacterized protein YjiK